MSPELLSVSGAMTYRSRRLDVLRAVAISLVVLRHSIAAPNSGPAQAGSEWLHNLALNGWLRAATIAAIRIISINLDPEQRYASFFWRYRAPFHFAVDGLVLGLAAALIQTRLKRTLRFKVGLIAAVGATALLVVRPWLQPGDLQLALIAWPALVTVCALMVLSTEAADATIDGAAWTRPFGWIAKLSYRLYLVHLPAAIVTDAWLPYTENPVASAGRATFYYQERSKLPQLFLAPAHEKS